MIKDIIAITKELLCLLELPNFTERERNYIISVVRRSIFIVLIELRKGSE